MDRPMLDERKSDLTRLRVYIDDEAGAPGDRLPSERVLCEALDRLGANPRRALDWAGYEAFDDELHRAIAAATDNPLLVVLYDQLNAVQRKVAWTTVVRETSRPPRSHTSFTEHKNIAKAIAAHDNAGAHQAMRTHIGSV